MKTTPIIVGLITVVSTSSGIAQEILVPDAPQWIGWMLAGIALASAAVLVCLVNERLRSFVLNFINLIYQIGFQSPIYRKDTPFTRQPLDLLLHLSQVTVEVRNFKKDRGLKFFLRGYNATPFSLEFKLRGGNIMYSKPKSDPAGLPTPALEIPWKHDGSNVCPPYKQFGLHIVQTFQDKAAKEVSDVLAGNGLAEFSFDKLEIYADTLDKKRTEIPLNFSHGGWTTIHLSRMDEQLYVSRVISGKMNPIVLGKARIGGAD